MLDHLGMPAYTPATARSIVRTVEAAEWPVSRVLEIARTQRIRTMLVQLRELATSDADASVVVVDPTGEMQASIHHPVVKRFINFLAAGTSIILKDVVAMKLAGARPFLVITAASIEQIFTSKGPGAPEDPIILSATQAPAGHHNDDNDNDDDNLEVFPVDTPVRPDSDADSGSQPKAAPAQDAGGQGGGGDASDNEYIGSEGVDALLDLLDPSQ